MNIDFKTQEQKEFEELAKTLVYFFSKLNKKDRSTLFQFAAFLFNNKDA